MSSKLVWGPAQWVSLHSFAACYEKPRINDFIAYVASMMRLLPCDMCRENFKKKLSRIPMQPFLESNETLLYWTYLMHDAVNQDLGKTSPPYKTVRDFYIPCDRK